VLEGEIDVHLVQDDLWQQIARDGSDDPKVLAAHKGAIAWKSASTILQSDETTVRVGKQNWWTWVFHHGHDCCFVIRPSRGKDVVEEFLGEVRPDFWVSDRFAAQMGWARTDQQVCLAHLIRDAQYAIDAGDTAFAPGLRKLLQQASAIGRRRATLADATLRAYGYKLDSKLDALLRITPVHGEGKKLQNVTRGWRRHMFVFLANRAIPPTNNGSEQALRPCVIFRKVPNCFRSEWAAHLYADIRSVIETARRRAIGVLDAIRSTLKGLPLAESPAIASVVPTRRGEQLLRPNTVIVSDDTPSSMSVNSYGSHERHEFAVWQVNRTLIDEADSWACPSLAGELPRSGRPRRREVTSSWHLAPTMCADHACKGGPDWGGSHANTVGLWRVRGVTRGANQRKGQPPHTLG
jgi:transposase